MTLTKISFSCLHFTVSATMCSSSSKTVDSSNSIQNSPNLPALDVNCEMTHHFQFCILSIFSLGISLILLYYLISRKCHQHKRLSNNVHYPVDGHYLRNGIPDMPNHIHNTIPPISVHSMT